MKLEELLKDTKPESSITNISVLIPNNILDGLTITMESMWQDSSKKGWVYRVDPPNPNIPLLRHVHIAKEKHKSSKNMQASWNEDGTRHDKSSFNTNVGSQAFVRTLAREVLGIGSNITLESEGSKTFSITDSVTFSNDSSEAFISFVISA